MARAPKRVPTDSAPAASQHGTELLTKMLACKPVPWMIATGGEPALEEHR